MDNKHEPIILVDKEDHPIGIESKEICHQGKGLLHRAFSVFIFNSNFELLLQQRSHKKHLWPQSWSNTCCSHPRPEEITTDAAMRRLFEEVGLKADLKFLYKFHYFARYNDEGSERELCHVYAGICDKEPRINVDEVNDVRWISMDDLIEEIDQHPENFTPWFKMEVSEITEKYMDKVHSLKA